MSVNKKTVMHVSRLARLDLAAGATGSEAEEKISQFAQQMDNIVKYMDILEQADTAGVEPMFSPMALTVALRADEAQQDYTREEILRGAPQQENGLFVVPKVL